MYQNINKLISISKDINKYLLDNKNAYVERNRKTCITDAILYKLLYTKSGSTQQKATIKLNNYKKRDGKISRQALVKKEKKISADFYGKLSAKLAELIKLQFGQNRKKQVIAVDGTYPTFLNTLTKDGFKASKTGDSVTPLITGLFNVTYNYPVTLELAKTKDERKEFMKFIKTTDKFNDSIFVFDRGYPSENFFKELVSKKLSFICRIKENSNYIDPKQTDYIVTTQAGTKIRVIKYVIKKESYYIATNLFDISAAEIKSIYHDRWTVEEYYKYVKQNMKLAKVNEQREADIRKTVMAHLIVSQITYLFANMDNKRKIDGKILNKSVLTEGIYDKFMYNFINNHKFTKYFLIEFFKTYVQYIKTNAGTSSKRNCKRANHRWYFKKYFKNVKSVNT
jgi:hypothetical protein